jgi:tautomerase-like protein
MITEDRGLGIERSDKIVVVQVTSRHQHGSSEKVAFYKNLCKELQRACGISPSDVVVTIVDISDDSFSLGLGRAQFIGSLSRRHYDSCRKSRYHPLSQREIVGGIL